MLCKRIVLVGPNKAKPELADVSVVGEKISLFAVNPDNAVVLILHKLQAIKKNAESVT